MDGALKQGIRILLILFLGWWLLRDPSGFASSAKAVGSGLWDGLVQVFEALRSFADSIGS